MRTPRSRLLRVLLALALLSGVATACGDDDTVAGTTTTTTTLPSTTTTTTTPPPPPTYPLTGLPAADPAVLARPALVVKIDNAEPKSRPQQGLNQADVVYEEMVEGFVTRFAAVFHSQNALNRVIPVRSARTTDIPLFTPLLHPLFAWSGANAGFAPLIQSSPIVDVGYYVLGKAEYHRDAHRPGSHDLWTTTEQLWTHTPAGAVPPPALFTYRAPGAALPAGARPTGHAYVSFGGGGGSAPVDWRWDAAVGGWRRDQKGTPHVDETGQQIAPANVVIQFVKYHDTGFVDTSGAKVYVAELVGSGRVLVLTAGSVAEGTWSKASPDAVTTYTDAAGQPMALTPGQTFVQLPWDGVAMVAVD
jgi:hypothetical protein